MLPGGDFHPPTSARNRKTGPISGHPHVPGQRFSTPALTGSRNQVALTVQPTPLNRPRRQRCVPRIPAQLLLHGLLPWP